MKHCVRAPSQPSVQIGSFSNDKSSQLPFAIFLPDLKAKAAVKTLLKILISSAESASTKKSLCYWERVDWRFLEKFCGKVNIVGKVRIYIYKLIHYYKKLDTSFLPVLPQVLIRGGYRPNSNSCRSRVSIIKIWWKHQEDFEEHIIWISKSNKIKNERCYSIESSLGLIQSESMSNIFWSHFENGGTFVPHVQTSKKTIRFAANRIRTCAGRPQEISNLSP